MQYHCKLLVLSLFVIFFFPVLNREVIAQGKINWQNGYISAVGVGTATPSGNKTKDRLRAVRTATILGQRALLETVKGVRIDSQKKIENRMIQEDSITTRIEGVIRGAQIVKENIRWEGDRPIATVELQVCLGGFGTCKSEDSIITALSLDQEKEQSNAPGRRLIDIAVNEQNIQQKAKNVVYDSRRPVTGVIFNLRGILFERVILPVVITIGDQSTTFTVYSVKSVEPQVIRTYGVVRYADSVEQAREISYLGNNVIVVPVSEVTKENMIMIDYQLARIIRDTTSYGNDYLRGAKVVIAIR